MGLAFCGAFAALAPSALADGRLDRSFGENGVVDLRVRYGSDPSARLGVMRVGPEGGIFFTEETTLCDMGGCPRQVYLRRYRPNGRQDLGFGGGRIDAGITDTYADLVIDSSGRPLVALQKGEGVVIQRFRADGRPDRSFGDAGSAFVPCNCSLGLLKVVSRSKPLLIASFEIRGADPFRGSFWVMARLLDDGSPDRSFGGNGIVRHPMPGFYGPSGEAEPGGGAVLYGLGCCRYPRRPFVQRMSSNGHLQRRYAAATERSLHGLYGTRREDIGWGEMALVRRPDGRVEVFAGIYDGDGLAVRLLRSGRRDPSFGRRGVRRLSLDVSGAAADGRGGTFVVGYVSGRQGGHKVMRLRRDGRFDRRFGWVHLPRASNEQGLDIFSQGRGAAIVFDRGLAFCRQACEVRPKMYRVVDPGA